MGSSRGPHRRSSQECPPEGSREFFVLADAGEEIGQLEQQGGGARPARDGAAEKIDTHTNGGAPAIRGADGAQHRRAALRR
ncbi:MAG: hypothetical protein WDN48_01615 [Pseudolabrys sp.]